jgi:hypothetical protein
MRRLHGDPYLMSEGRDIPPRLVRRKTARRNLNKQREARRARQRAIKRKLAQAPKQPTITIFGFQKRRIFNGGNGE